MPLSHSHLPSPKRWRKTWASAWFISNLTILSGNITFNNDRRAVQRHILCYQIELLTFYLFPPVNHIFFNHLPISPFHFSLICKIWGDRQGQVPPCSPQLALTPVTGVSSQWEGDFFMLDAQFVLCLLSCPFASPTVELSDTNMKATVTECNFFSWLTCKSSLCIVQAVRTHFLT